MYMTSRKAQLGLNLVELMIGLVVGLIVLAAMTSVYLNASRGSKDTLNANRLNQDLRAVMDIMVADIRRAGYWGTAVSGSTNPFTTRSGTAITDIYIPASTCILYSYDATYRDNDTTGTPSPAGVDSFGYRLSGNAVQTLTATTLINNSSGCSNNAITWNNLTDPNVIRISTLTFTTGRPVAGEPGSQCLNADSGATWTVGVGGTTPACTEYIASGSPTPSAGARLAETRQITISITANYVNPADAADTSLSRTLTESVLVRNNRLCTVGTNCS